MVGIRFLIIQLFILVARYDVSLIGMLSCRPRSLTLAALIICIGNFVLLTRVT